MNYSSWVEMAGFKAIKIFSGTLTGNISSIILDSKISSPKILSITFISLIWFSGASHNSFCWVRTLKNNWKCRIWKSRKKKTCVTSRLRIIFFVSRKKKMTLWLMMTQITKCMTHSNKIKNALSSAVSVGPSLCSAKCSTNTRFDICFVSNI